MEGTDITAIWRFKVAMQLELGTDFCSCFAVVHWMLSDSVWQSSPLITLPKAARIHVQVLCQGALFKPLVEANWDADIYHAFSDLNEIPVVLHTHKNSYTHSHTFLFPLIHSISSPFSSFLTLRSSWRWPSCQRRALSLEAFPWPCHSYYHTSPHCFLTLYMGFLQTFPSFFQLFSQTRTKWE